MFHQSAKWVRAVWLITLSGLLIAGPGFSEKSPESNKQKIADEAGLSQLGQIQFPTSGSGAAQEHFLRGVAAMHSFWYEEALEEFRAATKADPPFAMGYWGEAMAHNHPIWRQQDTEAARQVLQKIPDAGDLTPRERAYLNAVKILYGEGDKLARDQAYAAAMQKIYRDYPEDLEAACFYALALLGTVRPGDKGFRRQMQAGAIAQEVYQKNPNHPGAAHYIIHSFDDPEHAILALPAARRYAEIAPAAHHARHMPSHIFLQLGMWPEAAASNESAWAVSDAWVQRKHLPISQRDYHSFHWLHYIYLQQGRYQKSEELLEQIRKDIAACKDGSRITSAYGAMAAAFVVETQRWDLARPLLPEPTAGASEASAGSRTNAAESTHCATVPSAYGQPAKPSGAQSPSASRKDSLRIFIRGLAAAMQGLGESKKYLAELRALHKERVNAGEAYRAKGVEIMELEVAAAIAASKGRYNEAIAHLKRAAALEESLSPPSGPPDISKPVHELLGEILLRAGRAKEAAQAFATALQRQPQRARSLLGAARAAAQSGDRSAARAAYSDLLRIWDTADSTLAERREAQGYLGQASAR